MKDLFGQNIMAEYARERYELEATEMLNSIEDYAWFLYCNIREFRTILQNLEDVRDMLAKR